VTGGRAGAVISDVKRIVRQWNREIEDDARRHMAQRQDGRWRAVVWGALWLLWLAALCLTFAVFRPLHW
jgi:hypothetical protein